MQTPVGFGPELAAEFERNTQCGLVGSRLLSESDRVRVWSLQLAPGERMPFHKHVLDYFWTAITEGVARSHYSDGRVAEVIYKAGDTKHYHFALGECLYHDLENIGDTGLVFTTVEFLDSANQPLAPN